jgi:serine/threonine protein phosphatase 1
MPARTIAIGDVHGCSKALAALLEAVRPTALDTLVTLGDYIDRGPDSRLVLDQLIDLRQRCQLVPLLGNHEEMLLAALKDRTMLRCWLSCGGLEMLSSYGFRIEEAPPWRRWDEAIPREHWSFLAHCRNYHETATHLFVHGGCDPNLPMDQQPAEVLRWQFTDPLSARPHASGKIIVCGHTPQRSGEILDLGFLICIDTGCHAGKWLTALDVHSGQWWQANQRGEVRQGRLDIARD